MKTPMKFLPVWRGNRYTFPLAAIAALGMFLISESSYLRATKTIDALSAQQNVRTSLQDLRRALTDAETGQRGYLLTGRVPYLEPYLESREVVRRQLDALHRYFDADPVSRDVLAAFDRAATVKLAEMAEAVRLHDAGDTAGWERLIESDGGRHAMDELRVLGERLFSFEEAKRVEGRASLRQTLMMNRVGVGAVAALCLLALYMYLRQTNELVRQREERRQLVQLERDQLERDVLHRTAHLTELTRHLQTVREDERHRLARELHDELGALLTAAKLDVARLKSRLGPVTPEVAERLQHLSDGLNSGIALKRRIIEDLRPSSLSNLGLVAALDILVREWSQRNELPVEAKLEPVDLTASGELTVYRLVQEALTNISKYAKARSVKLSLDGVRGEVRVSVQDDGIGFDVDAQRDSAHGLLGMRYRLESEGGRLTIASTPGVGTTVEASLPEGVDEAPELDARPAETTI